MGLVHHLADSLVVTPFKGVADVENPLDLSDDIFRPEEILLGDLFAYFFEPNPLGVTQEVDLRMVLLDGCGGILAGFAPLVISRGCEFVFHAGIDENQLVSLGIEGEILVFESLAVQADQAALLAENGSELVHDAAFHAAVVMLGALADLGKLELVDIVAEELVDGKGERALKGS